MVVNFSNKLLWALYSAIVTAVGALASKKAVDGAWQFVTGDEPPEPNDPATPTSEAVAWVLAVTLGVGLSSVLLNRFAARRWQKFTGEPSPVRQVNLRF